MSLFTPLNTSQYTFEGKRPDEKIHAFLYSHIVTLVINLSASFILILLPPVILLGFGNFIPFATFGSLIFFMVVLYYMLVWAFSFYLITMYLLDTWIVTDDRVLNMTQFGFFARTISEMNLHKVQDISVTIRGIIPTVFKYGNVEIQTAAATEKFVFEQVGKPDYVKDIVMELVKQQRERESAGETV